MNALEIKAQIEILDWLWDYQWEMESHVWIDITDKKEELARRLQVLENGED